MVNAFGPPPRILAVRFGSIGDLILITPLLRALRSRHPEAFLAVVTKDAYRPLLSDNPNIDQVVGLAPDAPLTALAAQLRAERFTHHLDLHGNLRSRALRWLVPGRWRGYPKHRWARAVLIRTKRNVYPAGTPAVAERMFAAAGDLDVTPDGQPADLFVAPAEQGRVDQWLRDHGLGGDRPFIVAAPMAAHATKRWPLTRWRDLVAGLTSSGVGVVVVGGPADVEACRNVAEAGTTGTGIAAGAMGLQGTAGLLVRAAAAVAGDTGVMHMSTAVGTPVIALFGPTAEPFGYFPYRAQATVIQRDLPCRPCTKMGGPSCPLGHHRCLVDIDADEVVAALEPWL